MVKKPETPIQDKGLTGTISSTGYGGTLDAGKADKSPAIELWAKSPSERGFLR
jgi:hypothetical protein